MAFSSYKWRQLSCTRDSKNVGVLGVVACVCAPGMWWVGRFIYAYLHQTAAGTWIIIPGLIVVRIAYHPITMLNAAYNCVRMNQTLEQEKRLIKLLWTQKMQNVFRCKLKVTGQAKGSKYWNTSKKWMLDIQIRRSKYRVPGIKFIDLQYVR